MKKQLVFFKYYDKHGLRGYHIPVRNSMNNRIEQEFIPAEAREYYLQKFGEKILSDEEFLDWYTQGVRDFNSVK